MHLELESYLWPKPQVVRHDKERRFAIHYPDWERHILHPRVANLFSAALGPNPAPAATGALFLEESETLPPQAYSLRWDAEGLKIEASDEDGFRNGAATAAQWLKIHLLRGLTELSFLEVEDRPALSVRGFMLDISRNRVPTTAFLEQWIDRLALLKFNQLQLYTEHTFAYPGHEEVWAGYDPITPEEMRRLVGYASSRGIELVPNQNSFGHWHRWLIHDRYRPLAEIPEGFQHPFSDRPEPFSLCPTDPKSLELLDDLYGKLLPCFKSKVFNVGLDETMDLGKGRSRAACEEQGKSLVYLDFLRKVRDLAAKHGKRIQYWADIVFENPDLINKLPEDGQALIWGYESDHPFDAQAQALEDAGIPFLLAPGTSSWNSVLGREQNARANIIAAVKAAVKNRALGILLTDWGDFGHVQGPSTTYAPTLVAAGMAWNPESETLIDEAFLATFLNHHFFEKAEDPRGEILMELGNLYQEQGPKTLNGAPLFFVWRFSQEPMSNERLAGLSLENLLAFSQKIHRIQPQVAALPISPERAEWLWSLNFLSLLVRTAQARLMMNGVATPELPDDLRLQLKREFWDLAHQLGPVWRQHSREGGLEQSRDLLCRHLG